jgi:hypothetical protein
MLLLLKLEKNSGFFQVAGFRQKVAEMNEVLAGFRQKAAESNGEVAGF